MKVYIYIYALLALFLVAGCDKNEMDEPLPEEPTLPGGQEEGVPEGYFVASFAGLPPETRAAVIGRDSRVQHVRYLVYKSTGEFVKTRVLMVPGTAHSWPFTTLRDTLPRGTYTAVFLGNVEKSLFPYPTPGASANYDEVLQNYNVNYSSARIVLPNTQFKDSTEYYLAKTPFSDLAPNPSVILQRVIGLLNVHRNNVDGQDALNKLVNNIVTRIGYRNIIKTTADGLLRSTLRATVGGAVGNALLTPLGGVDSVVNPIIRRLIEPVTDTLYNRFLRQLTNQLGAALDANEDQQGLVGVLGALLNPWTSVNAHTAIVTMRDFPKSVDFDLKVQERYTGLNKFRYDFTSRDFFAQKSIDIKGFSGLFNIQKIHVIKQGLVSGLLFNGIIDNSLLLEGQFVDIADSLKYTPAGNRRYRSNYSVLDVGLKSYDQQTDVAHSTTVSVRLGEIDNINGILSAIPILNIVVVPIVGTTVLDLVLAPIRNITITVPLNFPLLGVENITLSGGWSVPASY